MMSLIMAPLKLCLLAAVEISLICNYLDVR
jgi:hypothetical protein